MPLNNPKTLPPTMPFMRKLLCHAPGIEGTAQHIRPLEILILNQCPPRSPKNKTETQIARLPCQHPPA